MTQHYFACLRSQKNILCMRNLLVIALFLLACSNLWGQKMLLIERANRAKTTKLYIGETLRFRLAGKENYWYERTITDILPESNALLLDNFLVKLDSIAVIKVHKKRGWRILGGAFLTLGATLTFATTVGKVIYQDKDLNAPKLFTIAAVSFCSGWVMSKPRKLKLGRKHRLRIIEIKFPDPIIPPPTKKT
jgi:hypothetical protein